MKQSIISLNAYLKSRSKEICKMNECSEEEHNCESYAYIRNDMQLIDICCSDYFQGCNQPHAAIPLPWNGTPAELVNAVEEQCEDTQS